MVKMSRDRQRMEESLAEVAASTSMKVVSAIDEFLDTYEEVRETAESLLRPGQLVPHLDFSSLGRGESNRGCANGAKAIALDNHLAPLFGAVRVRFSKVNQSLLCTPVADYEPKQTDLARVTWSPDGTQMRVDLGTILAANGWRIPVGYVLRAEVQLVKQHPKIGSAMIIFLKDTGLRKKPKKEDEDENSSSTGSSSTSSDKESKATKDSKDSKETQQAKESAESKQVTEATEKETPATEKAG